MSKNIDLIDPLELLKEDFSVMDEKGAIHEKIDEEDLEDGLNLSPDIVSPNGDAVFVKREDTRSRLATIYTLATFFIFILGMLIAVLDGLHRNVSIIANLSEVIPLISGVVLALHSVTILEKVTIGTIKFTYSINRNNISS